MADKTKPIDIPKNENDNKNTNQSKYSLSYWLRSTEKKAPDVEIKKTTESPTFKEDNGIFSMSSNSEEESNTEEDSEQEQCYDQWDEVPRRKSCCRVLSRQFEYRTGYNSDTLVTMYEVAYDKANQDLDKFLLKCTVENFNLYTDAVLRNFAKNFHWFLTGVWFYSIQKPNKVYVPIYVSDCGHVCAEI